MSKITQYVRHLAVVAMATLAAQCAWAAATPKLLINSYNGSNTAADGWVNNEQSAGGTLPMSGKLSANGLSFSINNMNGNFLTGGEVSTDFESGTYTDIYGESHDSVVDEVRASLCLPEGTPFDANIYKSGNIQGAKNGNTATLEGLTPGQKYVVYLGFGRTGNDLHSFKIVSSQYGTVEAKEYLVTVGKDGSTTKATTYTAFNDGDVLQPGTQGLMVVRLKNITSTSEGKIQFTMPAGRSGINWLAVAEMDQAKITASIGGDTDWSKISWSGEVSSESMLELTLTSSTTLTMDAVPTFAGLKIKKSDSVEGTVDLKVIAKEGFLTVTPDEGVSLSTVEIPADAAEAVLIPSGDALNFIRTSGKTFVFKGTATTGVTLDYGTSTGAQMASHLVFESGKHAMTYGNDNSKLFATGHSNDNPTILVKNGVTLDLTAKDLSGWSGGADVTGVIRVNKGGTLNILQNSNDTFFYRQRLLLEPGAKVTHDFNKANNGEGRFRWQGGTEKSKAQIYMMDYAEDKTNDPAIIEQLGDSQLLLASDATRGLAIYVGAKAKLQIKSKVYVHLANNNAALAKYGEGTLELMGGATLYDVNIAEGLVKFNEDTDEHAVTISNSATGTGTLEFTKSEVTLGQNYRTMKLVLSTSATLNLTASTAEIADGAITLKTAMSADDFATLTVAVVNSASEEIEHETISVAEDGTVMIPLVTQGVTSSCAVSSWNSDWSGEVVVKGTAEAPTTITVDAAYPTGVTAVKVIGNVTLAYAEGATASTVSIQPQSGATVTITGTPTDAIVYAPVNGSTTTFATGSSIKLASGSAINGTVTIAKGATVELTAGGIMSTGRAYELHNHGTLELGGTQQQIQTANNNLQTFTQKLVFYSGSVTHGTRSSQAMEIKGGYSYRFFVGYDADAETPIATIDCDLGVSEWDTINCDFQIAQNAGLSLKSVSDAGTVSVSGTVINGLSIGNANNKAVALSANEKGLRGNVVIGAGTTLVLGGSADDRISYDTAPIAAFDIAGTLQCDRRQTIAANGKAASVTLRNGGSITGNGTANGQNFTCGLDVYNAFTITVDGAATIATPISITGENQVITIVKTSEVEAATLTLSGGVTGQNSGKIKLTEGTSLVVSEELADGKVITDVEGKHVEFDAETNTYSLAVNKTPTELFLEGIAAGGDVELTGDVTLDATAVIPADKTVTLDLNDHTITAPGTVIKVLGVLTVKDTGTNGKIVSTGHCGIVVGDGATLTVNSGIIESVEGAIITGKSVGAKITIKGGTFSASDNAVIAGNGSVREGDRNTIMIHGGTFNGTIKSAGYIACGIYAPWKDVILVDGGTFNITGGCGVCARAGTVEILKTATINLSNEGTVSGWVGDNKNAVPGVQVFFDYAAKYPALTEGDALLSDVNTFTIAETQEWVDASPRYKLVDKSTGPKEWSDVTESTTLDQVAPANQVAALTAAGATAKQVAAWATKVGINGKPGVAIDLDALALDCAPSAKQQAIENEVPSIDMTELAKGDLTAAVKAIAEKYPLATVQLVEATLPEGTVTTAHLYKLVISLKK